MKQCLQCGKDIQGCPEKWEIKKKLFFCSNDCASKYLDRIFHGKPMSLEDYGIMCAEAERRGLE